MEAYYVWCAITQAFKDHQIQEQYVLQSPLDYTLIPPTALTNKEKSNDYETGFDENKNLSLKISCKDVLDFMRNQLTNPLCVRKAVGILK